MHALPGCGCLFPESVNITDGRKTDSKAAFDIPVQPFSVAVADRGCCDYALLGHRDGNSVFSTVRHKDNIRRRTIKELPLPEKRAQDVLIDEIIELERDTAREKYPKRLRWIAVWNDEHGFTVELPADSFRLAASSIAALYKVVCWQIEIFFRNIKQLPHIKSFIGASPDAVETQIRTAMVTVLILTWLKHTGKYKWALADPVASLRLNILTKTYLRKWPDEPFTPPPDDTVSA